MNFASNYHDEYMHEFDDFYMYVLEPYYYNSELDTYVNN